MKGSFDITRSWASLCNNVSIIQAPEIQPNSNNENSPRAWLQFSLISPCKFEPSQLVFLIYRECLLQYNNEELPYILKAIFWFYGRWWQNQWHRFSYVVITWEGTWYTKEISQWTSGYLYLHKFRWQAIMSHTFLTYSTLFLESVFTSINNSI